MEQKRTLWILLAAGFFLLIVLCAAIIPFASSAKNNSDAKSLRNDGIIWTAPSYSENEISSLKNLKNQQNEEDSLALENKNADAENKNAFDLTAASQNPVTSAISSPEEGKTELNKDALSGTLQTESLTVISTGNTNIYGFANPENLQSEDDIKTTTINLTSSEKNQSANVLAQNSVAEKAIQETQSVKNAEKSSENLKLVKQNEESAKKSDTKKSATAKTDSSKIASVSSKTAKSVNKSAKSKTEKTTSSSSTEKIPDRFWVQASSYSSKKNADEAREILEANKIQCEVFTYTDSKGKLFYRVRIGPYTTKSEAEYWKSKIMTIPFFKNTSSYVTNSSASVAGTN